MNENALKVARVLQSNQTGYLHLYYQNEEFEQAQTIPIVENFLFALILFRTKTQESIGEAKVLLENLLAFQLPNGNFPIYVHEWPKSNNVLLSLELLLPFYRINQEFLSIMGDKLKKTFEDSFEKLLNYSRTLNNPLPYPYGYLLNNVLRGLSKEMHPIEHHQKPINSDQKGLCLFIPSFDCNDILLDWHPLLKAYVGAAFSELQERYSPKKNFYDVAMEALDDKEISRMWLYEGLKKKTYPQIFQSYEKEFKEFDHAIYLKVQENYALSLIEQKGVSPRGFHPLRLLFKGNERNHSFVFQGFKGEVNYRVLDNKIELICSLSTQFEEIHPDDAEEVTFFIDLHENLKFFIDGQKATTFLLSDKLLLQSSLFSIKMNIELLEGSGDFMGHIMRGNRPSQIKGRGEDRFSAYDLKIFLKTLRRTSTVKFLVKLEF
jgi:hypothetical protein